MPATPRLTMPPSTMPVLRLTMPTGNPNRNNSPPVIATPALGLFWMPWWLHNSHPVRMHFLWGTLSVGYASLTHG